MYEMKGALSGPPTAASPAGPVHVCTAEPAGN